MKAIRRKPRILAAVWFGLAAVAAAGIVWLPVKKALLDYVLLSSIAGGMAGYLLGVQIIRSESLHGSGAKSFCWGVLTTGVAHVIFGVVYSAYISLTHNGDASSAIGLAIAVAPVGVLTMGMYTLPVGGVAGWLLRRFFRRLVA